MVTPLHKGGLVLWLPLYTRGLLSVMVTTLKRGTGRERLDDTSPPYSLLIIWYAHARRNIKISCNA